LQWMFGATPQPMFTIALVAGFLVSIRLARHAAIRSLWILLVVTVLPVWLHPFHLDRFFLPGLLPIVVLSGFGWWSFLRPPLRAMDLRNLWYGTLAALVLAIAAFIGVGREEVAGHLLPGGGFNEDARVAKYQRRVLEDWSRARDIPTAGLERETAKELFDAIASAVGPDERIGWLGQSSEVSPAALHLALLERGGSRARFLRDAQRPIDVTPTPSIAPDLANGQLEAFCEQFDVLVITDPPDLKGRGNRAWTAERLHRPLLDQLGWQKTELVTLDVERSPSPDLDVQVSLCRRP